MIKVSEGFMHLIFLLNIFINVCSNNWNNSKRHSAISTWNGHSLALRVYFNAVILASLPRACTDNSGSAE